MNIKPLLNISLSISLFFCASAIYASSPKINIIFQDTNGVCKDSSSATKFSFNYTYSTNKNFDYFSGPVYVSSATQLLPVPQPADKDYKYKVFEITDSGMCGDRDLNYSNRGDCYNTNLIPAEYQNNPYSYTISIIPQIAPDQPYGKSYNLICKVKKF